MPIKSVIQLESLGHNGNHSLLSGDDIKPSLNLITFYESESATKTEWFLQAKQDEYPHHKRINECFLRNFQIISIGFGENIHYRFRR